MASKTLTALVTACVLLAVTSATAMAAPVDGPLINTTCSYAQLESALRTADPELADLLAERPDAQARLQKFVALTPDQRKQRVTDTFARSPEWQAKFDQKRATPEGQQKLALAAQIADTCHNY